ncbi:eukaryotic translation initiation factor NCBP isoform X2 [Brassica rapa]|uniref:eukaryotic translation initiation factor NCBP isoform X2 n=1 Tax=Brassica campestris TaxID=3711 RepID=UPI00142D35B6|nr:eukaryotic translation initiation factor NCBP isoform X2 [Brassica rapa]
MEITERRHDEIMDNVKSQYVSDERHSRELKAGLHPLRYKFAIWYTRRTPGVRNQTSYEDIIKKIVEFSTVEGFWACYCHLARSSLLPSPTDLHFFKNGIRPLWELYSFQSGWCQLQWWKVDHTFLQSSIFSFLGGSGQFVLPFIRQNLSCLFFILRVEFFFLFFNLEVMLDTLPLICIFLSFLRW